MSKVICFDLDDTLIDSDYKFQLTFSDCIKIILLSFETHGPQIDEVLEIARNLDNDKIANYPDDIKFKPQRLYDTWLETYAILCDKYHSTPKSYTKMQIKGIIGQNFDSPWYVIPGVISVLEKLGQTDYKLEVLTAGEETIQHRKVENADLGRYFSHVEVVPNDKELYLAKLAEKFGSENVVMIGNSARSDINPALKAGVKAIHIPRSTWHHYQQPLVNDKGVVIESIYQLPETLAHLWD